LEDVPSDAELIERELKKGNLVFEKIVVDTKEEYQNALLGFSPDIILSDHSLPAFNSLEALKLLKESGINIPFILVTATISEEFAVKIIKEGATDYILKDRLQRLPNAVKNALEKYRLEREKRKYIEDVIENEALMKDAEQMAHFGSFKVDNINHIVKWSRECYRIFGYKVGETEPSFENFLQNVHPADREFVKQAIYGAENTQNFLKINYRIAVDNNIKYIHSELAIEKNEYGKPVFIKGFVQDITNIKQSEELRKRSEANLNTLFNNTDTAYILFSTDQKIISFNNLANVYTKELYGKELSDGLYAFNYFSEKRLSTVNDAFQKATKGENTNYETSFFNGEGEVKCYYSRWLGVAGEKDINLGVILAISDITERKLAELEREKISKDLIQRNNALEQFAFIVSHNLRAPVANIIGLSDALCNWDNAEQRKQDFINGLSISAKKLDEVVHDLNNILRISQRVNEQKEVTYFQQLVEDIKSVLFEKISGEAVIIKTDFTKMMNTYTLKSYLYNIFYELILNSINFKQPFRAPIIEIKSYEENKTFKLLFKDNGKGIDLAKHGKHIFGLYQRFDTSVEGRGMGLCMVKTQIETLGGTIKVESELNKGTTFIIEMPV